MCGRYLQFRKDGLDIRAIKYEELCADPTYSISEIFKFCGLPQEWVALGKEAMDIDSQKYSILNHKNVHMRPLPVMDPKFQVDADAVCYISGVPRHPNPCVLEATLTHKLL